MLKLLVPIGLAAAWFFMRDTGYDITREPGYAMGGPRKPASSYVTKKVIERKPTGAEIAARPEVQARLAELALQPAYRDYSNLAVVGGRVVGGL